ncbi:siderophore ABC transporter substrate-binding protein [Dermacoccaceae bacterium W4C1]
MSVRRTPTSVAAAGVAGLMLLSACGSSDEGGSGGSESAAGSGGSSSGGDSSGTVQVTDAEGKTVSVPKNPGKVVVMDWSVARSLTGLGVEIAGLPKANSTLPSDLKPVADKAKEVGTLFEPDYEGISELNPDMVVVASRSANPKVIAELKKITPNVLDMSTDDDPAKTVSSVRERYTQLAKIYGKESQATTTLAQMDKNIAGLKAKASASDGTTMFASVSGGKVSVYGKSSRFGRVWTDFGFKPVDAKLDDKGSHGEEINQEFFVKYNPAHILVLDRGKTVGDSGTAALDVLNNGLVNRTDAAKNKKIAEVDGFSWYLAPDSPASVNQMVTDATKAV